MRNRNKLAFATHTPTLSLTPMTYLLFSAVDRFGPFAFVISAHDSNPEWPGLRLQAVAGYEDKNAAMAALVDLQSGKEAAKRCVLVVMESAATNVNHPSRLNRRRRRGGGR